MASYLSRSSGIRTLANKQTFPLADKALFYLVRANHRLGKMEDVSNYFDTLQLLYPNSEYILEASKSLSAF
jgi:hypothetical protein